MTAGPIPGRPGETTAARAQNGAPLARLRSLGITKASDGEAAPQLRRPAQGAAKAPRGPVRVGATTGGAT